MLNQNNNNSMTNASASSDGLRVLIVDKDESALAYSVFLFTTCKYRVTPCSDPADAALKLITNRDEFDLVVCDSHSSFGYNSLREAAKDKGLPFVVTANDNQELDKRRLSDQGAARAFFMKPMTVEEAESLKQQIVLRNDWNGPNPPIIVIDDDDEEKEDINTDLITSKNLVDVDQNKIPDGQSSKRTRDFEIEVNTPKDSPQKKKRFIWTPERHRAFETVYNKLGEEHATPSKILKQMKELGVTEVTREKVSSHLQKYKANWRSKKSNSEQASGTKQPLIDSEAKMTAPTDNEEGMFPSTVSQNNGAHQCLNYISNNASIAIAPNELPFNDTPTTFGFLGQQVSVNSIDSVGNSPCSIPNEQASGTKPPLFDSDADVTAPTMNSKQASGPKQPLIDLDANVTAATANEEGMFSSTVSQKNGAPQCLNYRSNSVRIATILNELPFSDTPTTFGFLGQQVSVDSIDSVRNAPCSIPNESVANAPRLPYNDTATSFPLLDQQVKADFVANAPQLPVIDSNANAAELPHNLAPTVSALPRQQVNAAPHAPELPLTDSIANAPTLRTSPNESENENKLQSLDNSQAKNDCLPADRITKLTMELSNLKMRVKDPPIAETLEGELIFQKPPSFVPQFDPKETFLLLPF